MYRQKEVLLRQYMQITAVVAAYWFVSISLVFINKYLLSGTGQQSKLDAPLFVTWFQCVVTVVLCITLNIISKSVHHCFGRPVFTFASTTVTLTDLRQVLPVSVVFVAMISFNNLCLKYVDVSFYYIGRSLTTVFNVLLTYLILHQKTSFPAIVCCAVIVGGFFLGVDQESVGGTLSVTGVTFGILASIFVALNSIYIKKVLNDVKGDVSILTYYNNINACIMFPPLFVLLGEGNALLDFVGFAKLHFWVPMLLSGVFGFAIGYLTSLQVKVTSALTNNISGTAKACAQTVLASVFYNEMRSPLWWLSNVVVLGGSAAYTRVKQLEMVEASKRRMPSTDVELSKLEQQHKEPLLEEHNQMERRLSH